MQKIGICLGFLILFLLLLFIQTLPVPETRTHAGNAGVAVHFVQLKAVPIPAGALIYSL